MNVVTVHASRSYDIRIGNSLLQDVGSAILALGKCRNVCIVSDSNVWPLYGQTVKKSLLDTGFRVSEFVFPAGEEQKNANTYLSLLDHLSQEKLTRSDILVALGGGVVGDLTGFAAATYLRGIRFIQIPTTLLAAVDSSVGGKTAINLQAGKNLAGAFCQPSLVLCDVDTLDSLPAPVFLDGCAEVIKYAVLYDEDLFHTLQRDGLHFNRQDVITRCVTWKRTVVMEDEFDTGARMKLNLGHTIGHGVEAASNFTVSHGSAVAIGMAVISRAFPCNDTDCILQLLNQFDLPVHCKFSSQELLSHILSDKKRDADSINLIVPRQVGSCSVIPTPVSKLNSILQAGL